MLDYLCKLPPGLAVGDLRPGSGSTAHRIVMEEEKWHRQSETR